MNTEKLSSLSVTAVRHDMPFNKKRFFRFHYHTLDNSSTGGTLSFSDIKWQKLISRRYTSLLKV
ncbi:hypothetical protein E4524_21190 [Escherichia coli]|nr:hypothetical protein [Escherichia coli]EFA4842443.1 hypothetical protein [Escherichia coli]EFB2819958.1 hypothetical protein [Escherichia coli]EFB5533303.1 hypothetical protein [Escherichia coli]EFH5752818.1 hypothetical protein [Escherichia coli]